MLKGFGIQSYNCAAANEKEARKFFNRCLEKTNSQYQPEDFTMRQEKSRFYFELKEENPPMNCDWPEADSGARKVVNQEATDTGIHPVIMRGKR